MRNATTEYTLRGHTFQPGDAVLLSYRRPTVTRRCSPTRSPSTSGARRTSTSRSASGVHYCLEAMLAHGNQGDAHRALLRLGRIELAGEPAEMQTLFVGGLKRLPISYDIT
ncbi:MAG: hypothetical protein R2713_00840 [Ilumatobacteraceae bacterium]